MSCVRVAGHCSAVALQSFLSWACSPGPSGGPVAGPVDNHCFVLPDGGFPGGPLAAQPTRDASCHPTNVDGGTAVGGYGPTNYNASAGDDDCKYLVGFSSTPIRQNENVTFTVSVVRATDGTPVAGANTYVEAFTANHPPPNTNPVTAEVSPGVYTIGPVQFDRSGQWTVRFHFHGECDDLTADSPHGHAAFFVSVP